jgi:hypothetical protein
MGGERVPPADLASREAMLLGSRVLYLYRNTVVQRNFVSYSIYNKIHVTVQYDYSMIHS